MAESGPGRDGLVIVDKASGLTSHDVVARLRRIAGTRKVGHAGTLDPMATGVLVAGIGRATRLLHHLVLADKAYTATIRLGRTSSTDDAEGELSDPVPTGAVDEAQVRAAMAALTGAIEQVPSAVSAIKVDGVRSYARVRAGQAVDLPARPVTVSRFELTAMRPAGTGTELDVVVECSSGTYVRALARDLGAALQVGGHLSALRRTRVGPFTVDDAVTLETLADRVEAGGSPLTWTLPEAVRAALPVRDIDAAQARTLSYGQSLDAAGIDGVYGALHGDTAVALLDESGGPARPVLVFTPA